ncbi:hypothetical protein vseg_008087 [Gypsophila vaccaria]
MATSPPLTREDHQPIHDQITYRAIVGSLQYLLLTRPDIAFAINRLTQFLHHPTTNHWTALKRLLRYLQGTQTFGTQLYRNSPSCLHAFCDADHARDKDNYVSTTDYIIYLGRIAVLPSPPLKSNFVLSHQSHRDSVAPQPSDRTSYNCYQTQPPAIFCDNISATLYAKNPVFHSRMKHMALSFHFVKEQLQQGQVRIQHVASKDQLADILTKPLHTTQYLELRNKIGPIHRTSILRGRTNHIDPNKANIINTTNQATQ